MKNNFLKQLLLKNYTCCCGYPFSTDYLKKIEDISLQVYSVVDEMFLAGEIRETSQTKVLKQLLMLGSLE